jgi:ornithine cyclodeaminase/alanine dehydrogenase-like protein (mu-crystallin family)
MTEMPVALCLTEADIRAVLPLRELIEAMETALVEFSAGRVVQPVRTAFDMGEMAFFGSMPAYIKDDPPTLGSKLVTVVAANASKHLPTHQAAILLFDPECGSLIAILDGRLITEVRTAAVSALSVRLLARADAAVRTILASGVQARSHLETLSLVRTFREVRAWSPTPNHLREFASSASVEVRTADNAEQAVRGRGRYRVGDVVHNSRH